MVSNPIHRPRLLHSVAVVFCGVLWGLYWIPARVLDASGVPGTWGILTYMVATVVVLLPIAIYRRRHFLAGGLPLLTTGAVISGAFVCYAHSFLYTDIVRAILLFYLSPVWATVLSRVLLHEHITRSRYIALILGITGLFVILEFEGGFPLPRNFGDWMGLVAGFGWAYGSLRIHDNQEQPVFETSYVFFATAVPAALLMLLLPQPGSTPMPTLAELQGALGVLTLLVAVFMIPSMFALTWGARALSPGRVGILMMGEAIVGIGSAAWLTDEPFGVREITGSALIIGAGLIEVFQNPGDGVAEGSGVGRSNC